MPLGTFHHATARNVMKVNVSESYFLEPLSRIHLAKNSTIFLLNEQGRPSSPNKHTSLGPERYPTSSIFETAHQNQALNT